MTRSMIPAAFGAALLMAATSAAALTPAVTTDPLNLRAGPGPGYAVTSVLAEGTSVSVLGCIDNSNWCRVDASGSVGYVYSDYLNIGTPTQVVVLGSTWKSIGLTAEQHNASIATAADPTGVLSGRDSAVDGDRSNMGKIEPSELVTTYVLANPGVPVILDGEVMLGVGVPETVTLLEAPQSEYRYAFINGRTVLIEPTSRRVVYVYQ